MSRWPSTRCAGVVVPASVDDGISDTESVDSDPDRTVEGSSRQWEVGEMVAPVRPSAVRGQDLYFLIIGIWGRFLRREVA